MSLRQRLLLLFSLTVTLAVATVAWTVLVRMRHVFEQRDQEETALLVGLFQREFQHRSAEVTAAVERLSASEHAHTMALELGQSGDAAPYLTEAGSMAADARLDFLEIVGPDGNVVSSAQWPARFGYAEPAVRQAAENAFLKREQLPDTSSALGLFSVRAVRGSDPPVVLVGGRRLDQGFLADLAVAPGIGIALYGGGAADTAFDPAELIGSGGPVPSAAAYQPLIDRARREGRQTAGLLELAGGSASVTATPLRDAAGNVLAVLTVAIPRRGMLEAQQHIRAIACGVASAGILLSIVFSLWVAARVSRPIEQLARAAGAVAGGDWEARVPVRGRDEVGVLARSFNHMTRELASQRERLVQSERVAAWRELARRLAHELKNPLFPLQLTVENMVRARALSDGEFEEVFCEGTETLSREIAHLKTIISRFSDFSRMPRPEPEPVDAHELVARVRSLYDTDPGQNGRVLFRTEVASAPMPLMADPEMLHRALSNLVLNAIDAMPDGGTVTLGAEPRGARVEIRVSDTGCGLSGDECGRLFTPYYTTKAHGTGLGLAIVQSVVSDHAGTISVESAPGKGTAFIITLPGAGA